jgi:hypothetical protein
MPNLRRILFADIGTKALSLILALAVYVHVFSGREQEMTYRVPLAISPLPAGLTIANELPTEVRVRVRASGKDLLKLRTRPFRAEIAIDSPRAETLQRPILGSDFRMPQGVRVSSVEVLDPRALTLSIERVSTKTAPVAVRVQEEPGDDRALLGRPTTAPRSVRLIGPASILASIDSAETEPIPIGRASDREAVILTPTGVSAEPPRVSVRIATDARHTRRFAGIPIELAPPQKERLLWVQPPAAQVALTGAASVVDLIPPSHVHVIGELGRTTVGAQRVRLRVVVSGLTEEQPLQIACFPESASVRLQ